MAQKNFLAGVNAGAIIAFAILIIALVAAQNSKMAFAQEETIIYPVAELGGCKNKNECYDYCEQPENLKKCIDFAEQNSLMSAQEVRVARKFVESGAKGPGGCSNAKSCEAYCNDISRINECVAYAEKTGIMDEGDLEEARKVQQALAKGAKLPGGCRNKEECEAICTSGEHMEECIEFATAAGFADEEELEEMQQVLAAIKKGVKPPKCGGKRECDAYCRQEEHIIECVEFAVAAGFMDEEEAEMVRKTGGRGPGGCIGKEECDAYCDDPNNITQCVEFGVQMGFVSPEEAEMIKKTGGKGPGGCRGRDECDAFCNNPANQETCLKFGLEHGLIPPEELEEMENARQSSIDALEQAPEEVLVCVNQALGYNILEKLKAGGLPVEQMGNIMQSCFSAFDATQRREGPGPNGGPPDGPYGGPQEGPPQGDGPPHDGPPPGGYGDDIIEENFFTPPQNQTQTQTQSSNQDGNEELFRQYVPQAQPENDLGF